MYRNDEQQRSRHRLFYALPLPEKLRKEIGEQIESLSLLDGEGSVRWVDPKNLHITLRFLGELSTTARDHARTLLGQRPEGIITLQPGELNAFPTRRRPSVIILDVAGWKEADQERLRALQQKTEEWSGELGCEPDVREFHPHITLGRVRRGARIGQRLLQGMEEEHFLFEPFLVDRILLMESHLSQRGAEYVVAGEEDLR